MVGTQFQDSITLNLFPPSFFCLKIGIFEVDFLKITYLCRAAESRKMVSGKLAQFELKFSLKPQILLHFGARYFSRYTKMNTINHL